MLPNIGEYNMIPIDSIQVISLPERHDRREILIPLIKRAIKLGIFPDIEIEIINRFPVDVTMVPSWWKDTEGYYRSTREHIEILQNLYQRKSSLAMIFEDDALIHENFYSGVEEFYQDINNLRPDWAALFLGGRDEKMKGRFPINAISSLNRGCLGSHAYIVNPYGIRTLHDKASKCEEIIDWSYMRLMGSMSCFYSPRNYMVGTQAGWSDNMKKYVQEEN